MKILNIYFKNLNSLEGETRIDFQKKPFLKKGVFVIAGPNGSGKSTILDAISLAFYGETFRFDAPAEHVTTRNTADSFAQVDFLLNNKKFRTRWEVARKGNHAKGAMQDPEMRLFSLEPNNDTLLEQDSQAVVDKITEIIGMDFHNFSRSIVLAQGDFAAFLNALDTERMDILERMSGSDIYAEHKKLLRDKKDQSEAGVKELSRELELVPVMDAVTLEASEADLADFKAQVSEHKIEQNTLREQLAWLKKLKSLEAQLHQFQHQKTKNQQETDKKQQLLKKISKEADVLHFKENMEGIQAQQQQFLQSQKNTNQSQRELTALQNKLNEPANNQTIPEDSATQSASEQKKTLDDLKYQTSQLKLALEAEKHSQTTLNRQLETKQILFDETQVWLETHKSEEVLLEGLPETVQLRNLRTELVVLEKNHQVFVKQREITTQVLEKNTHGIEQSAKKVSDFQQLLTTEEQFLVELSSQRDLEEIESLVSEQKLRIVDFKKMYSLAKMNQKVTNGGLFGFLSHKNDKDDEPTEEELKLKGESLAVEIKDAQVLQKTLEKAVKNEALIQKLRQHRSALEVHEACPLCGGLDHPFVNHSPDEIDSKQTLVSQKNKLKILMSEAEKVKFQIIFAHKEKLNAEKKQQQVLKHRSEWSVLSNRLNVATSELTLENLPLMKKFISREEDEFKELKRVLVNYQQQYKKIATLQKQLVSEKTNTEQLTTKKQSLDHDAEQLPVQLAEAESALKDCQEKEKNLAEKVMTQLETLGEPLPTPAKEAVLLENLAAKKQDYELYLARYQQLTKELEPLKQQQQQTLQKSVELTEEYALKRESLGQEESVSLHLAIIEKQKILSDQQQYQEQQQQQLQNLKNELTVKLKDTVYENPKQVREALDQQAKKSALENKKTQLKQQLESLEQKNLQTQAQLSAEQAQAFTEDNEEELNAQQRSVNEKVAISQDEIRHLEDKQRKQQQFKERHDVLTAKLEEEKQALAENQEQVRQSEENGIVFRRRVQLHLATQLLSQTNKVLEKISGRYYLRQAPSDLGFALEIEDTFQQNSRRLPKSLSGGESFVVSLALAIGLAEMASNGTTLDSLFLDEGFGNLDAEALVMVVSTLQQLQTHGKTVGVISHVDGVRKRIKTRIEMVKKPNGLSQLKKVS